MPRWRPGTSCAYSWAATAYACFIDSALDRMQTQSLQ